MPKENNNNQSNEKIETKDNDLKNLEKSEEDVFEKEFLSIPQLVWRSLKRHKLGITAMWVLILLYFFAVFAPVFSPMFPYQNHIRYRFKAPDTIHRNDLITGERIGMHVYLQERVRDPVTFVSSFEETTHFETVKGFDFFENKVDTWTLGEYHESYGATITNITYNIRETVYAKKTDGELIQLSSRMNWDRPSLLISYFNDEHRIGDITYEDDLIKPDFSKFLSGESILYSDDSRPMALRENKQQYPQIADLDIESIQTYRQLETIVITAENFMGTEIEPSDLHAVNFKNYKINFFVRSWEYKLFGFIPGDFHLFGVEKSLLPHFSEYETKEGLLYIWGADQYGRDLFGRIIYASRVSLTIGLIGIAITFTIGLLLGGSAGFFGGWIDEVLMRFTEILMSIPGFYLLISLAAVLPRNLDPAVRYMLIIVILSFMGWPGMSRVIRGMTLGLKRTEFIEAAIALGYPPNKVIRKHLLPNTATYVIVSATLSIPGYIIGEAGLSFLGIGITEPSASWGLMLSQAQSIQALTEYPWLLLPGLFIFITVMAYNLFGDAIRDALDPRSLGH